MHNQPDSVLLCYLLSLTFLILLLTISPIRDSFNDNPVNVIAFCCCIKSSSFHCKIRIKDQQNPCLKYGITEVSSTGRIVLWRQRGCYDTWNDQPFTF